MLEEPRPSVSDVRDAIIDVSLQLATEVGEEGLTMRGVAHRLGISISAIYHHFESKAALMRAIRMIAVESFLGEILQAFSGPDRRGALVEVSRSYVRFARENPWMYELLMQGGRPDEEVDEFQRVRIHDLGINMRRAIIECCGELLPADPRAFNRRLAGWWSGLHGVSSLIIGRRLWPEHAAVPIDDFDAFLEEYLQSLVDSVTRPVDPSQSD
jgi:AcrR family transcriptional regulator